MAKILIFNPNTDTFGRQSIPTTYISSVLKNNGHQVELFDTTFIDISYLTERILHLILHVFFRFWEHICSFYHFFSHYQITPLHI